MREESFAGGLWGKASAVTKKRIAVGKHLKVSATFSHHHQGL